MPKGNKDTFLPLEVNEYARGMFDVPLAAEALWLGLYLLRDFPNVFKGYQINDNKTELTSINLRFPKASLR